MAKAVIASYVGVLLFASLLFVAAGKVSHWQGLLYVALAVAGTTLNHLLVPRASTITADRAREATKGQDWDKRLLGLIFLVSVVMFVTAGLDSGRFLWSGPVPMRVTAAGAALMLLGQALFAMAKRENAFFSSTVRIQTERGHLTCESGPYRVVRHPGYLGMLMSLIAFPLVLNSYWAFLPAGVGAVLLVARTVLEDRFLRTNLPGYADYTMRTRWILLPGVF